MALSGYKPISDYGLIGNLRTAALVCRDGSIDWCPFPHMDCASVFAAVLDARKGGRFQVSLPGAGMGSQGYAGDTNVLETRLQSDGGNLVITDFMPLSGNIHGCAASHAPAEIHRILACEGSDLEVAVEWSPRFDYARASTGMLRTDGGWTARGNGETMSLGGVEDGKVINRGFGPELHARFRMRPGEMRVLVTRWGTEETGFDLQGSLGMMQATREVWSEWAHREGRVECRTWAGPWSPLVTRSALAIKLLTHADTGAIAAAPTTSLPEAIGGVRNWDYRYTWIRDASLSSQALISMGHSEEALELLFWIERVSEARFKDRFELQIMYGLHGESEIPETPLEHLEGYMGSRPVNIGNAAAKQFQLETFGELLNTGYELVRRGEELGPHLENFLCDIVEIVADVWEKPDYGIWEMRGEPRHFTYSKVMAWVAFDRAIYLAERYGLPGNVEKWRTIREAIRRQVLEHGYDRKTGSFVISYGARDLDAANIRIPLLEFLPFDDPRVQGTIDRTMEHLMENGLVYRYRIDDGLPDEEGAFGLCTFWLVDALALSNRLGEARDIFEKAAARANHTGLFPEQFDPATGRFLGNFPQAFTHIGFINSTLYLAYAEGRDTPEHAPVGTPAHRRSVLSFYGLKDDGADQ